MFLDDTGRGSNPNVTDKKMTLISDHLDEDKLQTLLHSIMWDSIRMSTNNGYTGTSNLLLFLGKVSKKMNFSKREVHHPKDSDVLYAFDVPQVHVTLFESL